MTGSTDSPAVEQAQASAPAPEKEAGFKGWYTVVMLAGVIMLGQIDRNIISLMVQPIKRDLGLSDTEMGILTGLAFSITYVMFGPPIARGRGRVRQQPGLAVDDRRRDSAPQAAARLCDL